MSITQSYYRLSDPELQQVLGGAPEALSKWFGPGYAQAPDHSAAAYSAWYEHLQQSGSYLDINTTWQALHFLLTGEICFQGASRTPPPLCNVIMGGTPTNIETTYGVAFYLTPPEVAEVATLLQPLIPELIAARYDAQAFQQARVYPSYASWKEGDATEFLDEYENLRAFFQTAARENQAMIITSD